MLTPLLWPYLYLLLPAPDGPARPAAEAPTAEAVLTRMATAIDRLQTLRCTVRATERHGSRYQPARTLMKITTNPQRVYLRNQKGIEVLWVQGQNDGDAWVYPNRFPYVTLSLDPQGTLMRRGQHHSVLEAGFGTIAALIRLPPQRSEAYRRSFRYLGDTTLQGRPCYLLRSDYAAFRYVPYKATGGETAAKIAERFGCGEFRIVERNGIGYADVLPAGKTLHVPNAYGRRTILCIDPRTSLPVAVAVWDDKGLFETFEFSQVTANQPIPLAEFSPEYPEYKL